MKATEGVGFVDPRFRANRSAALAAGFDVLIMYHFARPDLGNSDIAEANFMQSVVGPIRNSDMIILDYEVQSPLATAQWALGWLVEFGPKYGKLPGIYASSAYILEKLQWPALEVFPLWLANWQFTPDERPPVPAPWTSYEFVQFTDRDTGIPGIQGSVDADIFLGGTTPMPAPTPTQPSANQLIAANNRWYSVLKNDSEGPAPTGTGIYEAWLADYIKGIYHGPPLTHEYHSVDWSGNPIVIQEFAYGWVEWSFGSATWYGPSGKI
jgi:GH25 family lysozyme M1 (1,4-beta-N-acetylmuramidase)